MANATAHYSVLTGFSGLHALTSWHILETSGVNPVAINVRDGGPAGPVVVPIRLEAFGLADMDYTTTLYSAGGWYIEVAGGTATGAFSGWG